MNMLLSALTMSELEFIDIEPPTKEEINKAKHNAKYYLKYGRYPTHSSQEGKEPAQ